MTQQGMILGTAAYMAPEQAKGRPVDKRSDIWAFGVVLYEMLSGRTLFAGESAAEVLGAVLRQNIDLAALPAGTPHNIRRLLRRCLERDPKQRLHDIADARIEIVDLLDSPEPNERPARLRRRALIVPRSPAWRSRSSRSPASACGRSWPKRAITRSTGIPLHHPAAGRRRCSGHFSRRASHRLRVRGRLLLRALDEAEPARSKAPKVRVNRSGRRTAVRLGSLPMRPSNGSRSPAVRPRRSQRYRPAGPPEAGPATGRSSSR